MLLRQLLVLAPLPVALALTVATPARAAVVERVVAVVGERAILLSDVRARARPFLARIHAELPAGAQRAAAISQLHKVLLERMIDEELQQRAASRARLTVTSREIDEALRRIARQNRVQVAELLAEASRSGLDERAYRDEVRRQVLEAKLMNLRLQGRIRVSEEDLRKAYLDVVLEERRKLRFRASWIVLPATDRGAADRLATELAHGADFASLARRHSVDPQTKEGGGDLGWVRPGALAPTLDRAARGLEVGQVSSPLRVGDQIFLLRLMEREESDLPSYEEAREELQERVYVERMNKARRQWLDGLRRRTHVEVRM